MKPFVRQLVGYSVISALINISALAPRLTWAGDPNMAASAPITQPAGANQAASGDPDMAPPSSYSSGPAASGLTYQAPSAEAMFFDGLIFRPLMLVTTVIGVGVFLGTLPFSTLGGNVDQAAERLVVQPAQATFTECLGCLPGQAFIYGGVNGGMYGGR